jgi:hypothetical protein
VKGNLFNCRYVQPKEGEGEDTEDGQGGDSPRGGDAGAGLVKSTYEIKINMYDDAVLF